MGHWTICCDTDVLRFLQSLFQSKENLEKGTVIALLRCCDSYDTLSQHTLAFLPAELLSVEAVAGEGHRHHATALLRFL